MQFEKQDLRCLRQVTDRIVYCEQTQEVRLPENMADIGSVLAAWGQVILRGKEWRTGGMHISGGVMAWVMYSAEGSGEIQCVEAWIPFQWKWEFPDTGRDGRMLTYGCLESMDARSTSARKLMLRVNVGVLGQAFVPETVGIYYGRELPEDVEILANTYPMRMPMEAGEKVFFLEEPLTLPNSAPKMGKLLHYGLTPVVQDQKVMADKVVFRGSANVHMLYMSEDGKILPWDFELPFSQYGELENDYEQDANAWLMPAVTALEIEQGDDGGMMLKAEITCQYVISQRQMIELSTDAYSTTRTAEPQWEEVELPQILQAESYTLMPQLKLEGEIQTVVDTVCYPAQAETAEEEVHFSGWCQMLYYNGEGQLCGASGRWEDSLNLPKEENARMQMQVYPIGRPRCTPISEGVTVENEVGAQAMVMAGTPMAQMTGITLGEEKEKDPNRPSLILRKAGQESLWSLAKACGTTANAIKEANKLTQGPAPDQMLIIPVP